MWRNIALLFVTAVIAVGCATTGAPPPPALSTKPDEYVVKFKVCEGDGGMVVQYALGDKTVGEFCSKSSFVNVVDLNEEGITVNFVPVGFVGKYEGDGFIIDCQQLGFLGTCFNILHHPIEEATDEPPKTSAPDTKKNNQQLLQTDGKVASL